MFKYCIFNRVFSMLSAALCRLCSRSTSLGSALSVPSTVAAFAITQAINFGLKGPFILFCILAALIDPTGIPKAEIPRFVVVLLRWMHVLRRHTGKRPGGSQLDSAYFLKRWMQLENIDSSGWVRDVSQCHSFSYTVCFLSTLCLYV